MVLKKYDGLVASQLKPIYDRLVENAKYPSSHNSDIARTLSGLNGFIEGKGGWDGATASDAELKSLRLLMTALSEELEKADVMNDDDLERTDV